MYLQFVDHLMSELETRLLASETRHIAQHFLPKKAVDIIHEVGEEIFQAYQEQLSVTRDELHSEIRRWRTKWCGRQSVGCQNLCSHISDYFENTSDRKNVIFVSDIH
ncbi:hypothetical protein DPMN_083497 [Dreissena polymorpha]|uniref:Uncharacterized protein n=1 Tax=Dreissena polymorpha TaxID=45954 RepID=A0A9D3Y9F7_DREPO|nr:hypothetical protein DPMN_083497 [Dreissena polymorpha]